ncbi:P-loop containing nucleoside triphosphate hydrolase protein [Chiua virens]|nr:P-loop containing nucleoside triphosphate hydrolase protein [Chiua virens]
MVEFHHSILTILLGQNTIDSMQQSPSKSENKDGGQSRRPSYQLSDAVQGVQTEEYSGLVNVEHLKENDIVIAVMGPTGSGKSTFICSASGRETEGVGDGLKSYTTEVRPIRFYDEESGQMVVLVDTPGFDDTYKSDLDILNMISDWLSSSYKKHKLLSGILYLHRIMDNRMAGTPLKNLRVFQKLCGKDALDKVYLTTTMWDEVDERVGERRLEELRSDYWKAMISQGAQVVCCRGVDETPKSLIRDILKKEGRRRVRLQEEMVEMQLEIKETEAGQELYSQLEGMVQKQTEILRKIGEAKKGAKDDKVVSDLEKEYVDLQAKIDEKIQEMEKLKLPRMRRFFKTLSSWFGNR